MSQFAEMPATARPMAAWPTSSTGFAGVVGFPIRHSLSPLLQNAAFAAMGLDWSYMAFEVPPGSLDRAVAGAAALGFRGLSVTMPHKDAAARLATRRSRQVRRLGAANTLIFDAGTILAESCDGAGLLDDLREGVGFDPAGKRCGVIGAGGAARAAVLALAEAGAHEIVIVNRTVAAAWRSVALAPNVVRVGRPDDLRRMDLVIQATPVAMLSEGLVGEATPAERAKRAEPAVPAERAKRAEPADPAQLMGPAGLAEVGSGAEDSAIIAGVDPSWFGAGQLIVDLVYDPPLTPFLLEARRQGAAVRSGLGMLVYQAARQIRLWTGEEPPLSVMWAVVGGAGSPATARGTSTEPTKSTSIEPMGGLRDLD
ncbi:MAG: shikimate dehydrogenase [Acidimicrobiales bacterium]